MAIKDALSGIYQLARDLTGRERKEDATSDVGYARIYGGEAIGDSVDGVVTIKIANADVVSQDETNHLEMQTSPSVKEGDKVMVANINGAGSVIYAPGEGDRQNAAISTATQIANDAKAIADAVDQHFFADTNGIHVTTDADDPAGTHNILINSLGLLLRAVTNNLVSITSSAIAFYDGLGNNASNIVASFGSTGATIGYAGGQHLTVDSNSVDIVNNSTVQSSFGASTIELGKNSANAVIEFCGNNGTLGYYSSSQQAYLTANKGAVLKLPNDSSAGVAIVDDSVYGALSIMRSAYYELGGETLIHSDLGGIMQNACVAHGTVGTVASGDTASGYWHWWKFRSGLCVMMAKFKKANMGMTQEWYQSYLTPGTFTVNFPVTLIESCVCCLMQPSTGNAIGGWISGQSGGSSAAARAYIPANKSVTDNVWWFCLFAGRWK